jgi:hypothetical protein
VLSGDPQRASEPSAVLAARNGNRVEQRLDGRVRRGARKQRRSAVADGRIGKQQDEPLTSTRRGSAQNPEPAITDLLVVAARGRDQNLDRRLVLLGKLFKGSEGTLLCQRGQGRPRITDLARSSLAARPEHVNRSNRSVVIALEASDRGSDDHLIRPSGRTRGRGRQQHEGR